jgi:predicted SprT family Zn-dependent metalloprotease
MSDALTMTKAKMLAIQAVPSRPIYRVHSCTCGAAPGTKPEFRVTEPIVRDGKVYRCSRCRREV